MCRAADTRRMLGGVFQRLSRSLLNYWTSELCLLLVLNCNRCLNCVGIGFFFFFSLRVVNPVITHGLIHKKGPVEIRMNTSFVFGVIFLLNQIFQWCIAPLIPCTPLFLCKRDHKRWFMLTDRSALCFSHSALSHLPFPVSGRFSSKKVGPISNRFMSFKLDDIKHIEILLKMG